MSSSNPHSASTTRVVIKCWYDNVAGGSVATAKGGIIGGTIGYFYGDAVAQQLFNNQSMGAWKYYGLTSFTYQSIPCPEEYDW